MFLLFFFKKIFMGHLLVYVVVAIKFYYLYRLQSYAQYVFEIQETQAYWLIIFPMAA